MTGPSHLILIGLMGSGKSSVGKICADRLERPFVDTDDAIAKKNHASVAELFSSLGEAVFRDKEQEVVTQTCSSDTPLVIACGGGAVLNASSRSLIKSSGTVVWLQADSNELKRRIGDTSSRPLLAEGDSDQVLADLAGIRNPIYQATADLQIDTQGRTVTEVADAVIKEYSQCLA